MGMAPIIPFRDYAPAIPIPQLYWNVVSAEQRVKRICQELARTEDYTEVVSDALNELIQEFEYFKQMSDFDFYIETYQNVLNRTGALENVLPIEDFSDEATVKAHIDAIKAVLPFDEFTDENTIKDAIDNLQDQINEFRPLTNAEIDAIVAPYENTRAIVR